MYVLWHSLTTISRCRPDPSDDTTVSRPVDHRAVDTARRRVQSTVGDRSSTVDRTGHVSRPRTGAVNLPTAVAVYIALVDRRRVVAKSRVWDRVPQRSSIISGDTLISLTHTVA